MANQWLGRIQYLFWDPSYWMILANYCYWIILLIINPMIIMIIIISILSYINSYWIILDHQHIIIIIGILSTLYRENDHISSSRRQELIAQAATNVSSLLAIPGQRGKNRSIHVKVTVVCATNQIYIYIYIYMYIMYLCVCIYVYVYLAIQTGTNSKPLLFLLEPHL